MPEQKTLSEKYKERTWESTEDWKNALAFAEKSLDEPYADPDDDVRTLSRQFLRMIERYDNLLIFSNEALSQAVQKAKEEERERCIQKVHEVAVRGTYSLTGTEIKLLDKVIEFLTQPKE